MRRTLTPIDYWAQLWNPSEYDWAKWFWGFWWVWQFWAAFVYMIIWATKPWPAGGFQPAWNSPIMHFLYLAPAYWLMWSIDQVVWGIGPAFKWLLGG